MSFSDVTPKKKKKKRQGRVKRFFRAVWKFFCCSSDEDTAPLVATTPCVLIRYSKTDRKSVV